MPIQELKNTQTPISGPFHRPVRNYSLFQAVEQTVQWLQTHNPDISEDEAFDLIRFRANPSLGFPGSDVESARFYYHNGRLMAELMLNLLGLHGGSSPLPPWYSEAAVGDDENARRIRDFLDLFNHRLQRLMRSVWLKYRYHAAFRPGAGDSFSGRMFSLIGLGHESLRVDTRLNWRRLLPYLGLLSQRSHSAALIEAVLRYYFQHGDITIEQCVPRHVSVPESQQNRLGQKNHSLGHNLVLGDSIHDRSSSFRIHVSNLTWDEFHRYLPGSEGYEALNELVRFTLKDPLNYDINLTMKDDAVEPLALTDDNNCRLGWTSWLGERKDHYSVLIADSGSGQA